MFNIARIPKPTCDILSKPARADNPEAQKIYVMIHGWCYAIPVYDPDSASKPVSVQEIEARIRSAVIDAQQRLDAGEKSVPIGVLSADERDRWTQVCSFVRIDFFEPLIPLQNLQHLLDLSPKNQRTHQIICQSLLGLSLDGPSPTFSLTGQEALTSDLLAIRSTHSNVANRIFDKPCTIIVDPSTRAGSSGEHSPCDALVPSMVADFTLADGVDPKFFAASEPEPFASAVPDQAGWERLDWDVDAAIEAECTQALARAKAIIDNSDANIFWFQDYGSDWVKDTRALLLSLAFFIYTEWMKRTSETIARRVRPDGAAACVLQDARGVYGDVRDRADAHVQARADGDDQVVHEGKPRLGAGDDGRQYVGAYHPVSSHLIRCERRPSLTLPQQQNRRNLLHHALHAHSSLTREATTGRGIDRHLLGLKLMLRPLSGEQAAFLDDELFRRSQTWKLSTSGLSAGNLFKGTGYVVFQRCVCLNRDLNTLRRFGALHEDGYGINCEYCIELELVIELTIVIDMVAADMIKLGIESKTSSPQTSTDGLKDAIFEALYDMKALCLATNSHTAAVSSRL